jgi:1-deoxy-D-xylulose-5-phosphate synthase
MVYPVLGAADLLMNEGIEATVINARYAKPLDETLLLDLARTHEAIVTVEENVVRGGFGSAVVDLFAGHDLHVPVRTLGVPDRFFEQASQVRLREMAGLAPKQIFEMAKGVLAGATSRAVIALP